MRLAAIACVALLQGTGPDQDPEPGNDPVAVFAELDGEWTGTFVGWNERGEELYRIAVRQRYETVNANTQKVTIEDTMADGTVIHGEGENTAHRAEDGTLRLRCVVRKSNGEVVTHDGRVNRTPDGREQIVWFSNADDRSETFREWVVHDGEQRTYHIHGMGRYGETSMLMAGTYARGD